MADSPTGTLTFLFTDIEGSTRMWEQDPLAMSDALARHDAILKNATQSRGGHVFKTVGDAFCVAFSDASDALEAALASQRSLSAEGWEEGFVIRARMALHAGTVEERDGDYFGPPVNRVARLLSAGHGGQTLLSSVTRELVQDTLPEGTELRDLGERRLKDLFRPERVFQLISPDLPDRFPPLKTLDARLNNLPVQPTPLVGRQREVAEVCDLLRREDVHLLTLTGPGGTGKTRLGLQVAAELLDEFEDGVFFVALAPIRDAELVASSIAGPLGVVEDAEGTLAEALKEHLRNKELLLLLDNFEQVVEAASLVSDLLSSSPRLKVLTTSRSRLRVYGEHEYAVPPLGLPEPGRLPPVERLTQYEAVRLFIERAQAVKAGFEVTSENAPAVAQICVRLDGLPLAIELAAARIRIFAPEAMLSRLGNRLKLLRGGARDLPARQQTLRGTIEWSHDLLEEGERMLFARLAVFVGGCGIEAIEAVCDAEGDLPVVALDGLESLVDKSLLRQQSQGEPRFYMLETIREYALERLRESGEAGEVGRTHAGYFLAMAEEAEPKLLGPEQVGWFDRLDEEHDNLRAALSWALEGGEPEAGLRLAGAMFMFWFQRGHSSEASRWLDRMLDRDNEGVPPPVRAKALNAAGAFAETRNELERGWALAEEAVALYRELDDSYGLAMALDTLGILAGDLGDRELEEECFRESLELRRELGDKERIVMSLSNLGYNAFLREDYGRATELLEESLVLASDTGLEDVPATPLLNLGWAALGREDHARAETALRESLTLMRARGDRGGVIAENLEALAVLAGVRGEAVRTARLWGAAEALRESFEAPVPSSDHARYERYLAAARSTVDEAAWEAAWAEGRILTPEEAVAYALGEELV